MPDSEGSSSGASLLDEPDDSSDDLDDSGADGYEEARATIVKHNVSLVSTATGADVQVIDGNSDGSDSTGTVGGGDNAKQTESQTPESTTPSTEPAYPAETESEPETEEETEDSPLAKTKAYQKLDYKTKYYKGSGTKKDPYVYLCKEGAEVSASFMNKILGFNTDGSSRKEGGVNKDGKRLLCSFADQRGRFSGGRIYQIRDDQRNDRCRQSLCSGCDLDLYQPGHYQKSAGYPGSAER